MQYSDSQQKDMGINSLSFLLCTLIEEVSRFVDIKIGKLYNIDNFTKGM